MDTDAEIGGSATAGAGDVGNVRTDQEIAALRASLDATVAELQADAKSACVDPGVVRHPVAIRCEQKHETAIRELG
jgi:hypothetical protein